MKRPSAGNRVPKPARSASVDLGAEAARRIDALYGLEPVLEPGAAGGGAGGTQLQTLQCPYCGESFETLLDLSAGSTNYVEDCQVCCQPIQVGLEVDHTGALVRLTALRTD
jgi:hypothetical protein